jgi:glycosyltransferase involved in cell wall biosynthesis
MKIALIIDNFDPTRGGAERSVFEMACCFAQLGHEVSIIAGKVNHSAENNELIKIVECPRDGAGRAGKWRSFEQAVGHYLDQNSFDVIHSIPPLGQAQFYQPRGGCISYNADRYAESFGHPLAVQWKRLTGCLNAGRAARIKSERALCQDGNGPQVVAVSHYVKEQFASVYGLDDSRVTVIANGIVTGAFQSEEAVAAGILLRQELNGSQDRSLFLFAAENPRLKGLNWLIRSVQKLHKSNGSLNPPFAILLIGNPKRYSGYTRTIQRANLEGWFRLVGSVSSEQMPHYYNACDAVVLPTYHDACSRVVMEGLAAGKPAITTRFNGARDFLDDGRHGIVLQDTGDEEALGSALLKMSDPQCRQVYLDAIQQADLIERLSMQRHVKELIDLYEKQ